MTGSSGKHDTAPAAWVIDPGAEVGRRLAGGLSAAGWRVASLDRAADFAGADPIRQALKRVEAEVGAPALIVYTDVPKQCLQSQEFATLSAACWSEAFQAALRRGLQVLQGVCAALAGRPASLVMVGPSVSLVGAAGLVALSALVEGQRALLKSSARQCGARGLRLNWLAVSSTVYAPQLAEAELPLVPELGPPPLPLGRAPDLERDAAAALAFLGSPSNALTGATLNLDGGEWMLP